MTTVTCSGAVSYGQNGPRSLFFNNSLLFLPVPHRSPERKSMGQTCEACSRRAQRSTLYKQHSSPIGTFRAWSLFHPFTLGEELRKDRLGRGIFSCAPGVHRT